MVTRAQIDAEVRATLEWSERVARNDLDWTFYREGEPRPRTVWQKLRKLMG
jgi:hypothetical protein